MSSDTRVESPDRVRQAVARAFGDEAAGRSRTFIRAGMSRPELARLYELVRSQEIRSVLEVGMANGTSSVIICEALADNGGGQLVSVDPFQTIGPPAGYGLAGARKLDALGFGPMHRLLDAPDYLALPRLVEEGAVFDMVFIDGYHSFDYTMVDMFFADLLLRPGGVLTFHDSSAEAVGRAISFLERHKPYERMSPPTHVYPRSIAGRMVSRLRTYFSGPTAMRQARSRREDWLMLSAYRKLESRQAPEFVCHPL